MMRRKLIRKKYFWLLLAMVFSLLPAACAPVQPGDPAYQWVVGKWVGETGYGNPADAAFQVQNGNQVTGGFTYHSASGRVSYGTIQSGVVGKKNDVDFIEGQIYWSFDYASTFRIGRQEGRLIGDLSLPGELPQRGFRSVNLTKAK